MAKAFKLIILTPEREFFEGEVIELVTGSTQGDIAILADHMPLVTNLMPSDTLIVEKDGKKLKAFTSSGILEVKGDAVSMLCDACEWPEEVDINRATAAKKRAESRLSQKDGVDIKRAELALARALARISIK